MFTRYCVKKIPTTHKNLNQRASRNPYLAAPTKTHGLSNLVSSPLNLKVTSACSRIKPMQAKTIVSTAQYHARLR